MSRTQQTGRRKAANLESRQSSKLRGTQFSSTLVLEQFALLFPVGTVIPCVVN